MENSSSEMEKSLYVAALNNDVSTLTDLVRQDPNLLERTNFSCEDKNPLHIAAMQGHQEFVQEILQHKVSFWMCLGRDRDGRNPLHLAAMYGKTSVLDVLIQAALPAALEKADGGGTILHLCVKYNQLGALKFLATRLKDPHFQNAKNEDGMTILHLAIYCNQMELSQEDPTLLSRTSSDCEDENALHAAATLGNEAFVKAILQANSSSTCYHMCLATDRDGRNPVHLAAMYGQLNILKLLKQHDRRLIEAALEKADRGGTILHLCVKHNQFEALKLLLEIFTSPEFVCTKNDDGMTILHLAIYYNQSQSGRSEMITYLIENTGTEMVNIKNANGKTAFELVLEEDEIRPDEFMKVMSNTKKLNRSLRDNDAVCRPILRSLTKAGELTGDDAIPSREMQAERVSWLETRRESVMVVAALIATMAFQAMVSPPGGVWQEDSLLGPNPHKAGEAVLAKTHPKYFRHLIQANTVAFVSSFGIIILQIRGHFTIHRLGVALSSYAMWLSTAAIGITYAISFAMVAPESERGRLSTTGAIVIILIMMWFYYCLAMATRVIYRKVSRTGRSFQVDPDASKMTEAMAISWVAAAAQQIYQMVKRIIRRSLDVLGEQFRIVINKINDEPPVSDNENGEPTVSPLSGSSDNDATGSCVSQLSASPECARRSLDGDQIFCPRWDSVPHTDYCSCTVISPLSGSSDNDATRSYVSSLFASPEHARRSLDRDQIFCPWDSVPHTDYCSCTGVSPLSGSSDNDATRSYVSPLSASPEHARRSLDGDQIFCPRWDSVPHTDYCSCNSASTVIYVCDTVPFGMEDLGCTGCARGAN